MLLSVSFYIVLERKGLGIVQLRQGPNKVRIKGILQPISDGVKLFRKEVRVPFSSTKEIYFLGPFVCVFCAYVLWLLFPCRKPYISFEVGFLFFLCVSSFRVYGVFLVGWVCDSRYSFLGAMRAVAQRISYEVFLRVCLFCPLVLVGSYRLIRMREYPFIVIVLRQELLILWLISILAETNRAPFDFVEGESELVAGYNVEFGGVGFSLLALAEYRNILFIRIITRILFVSSLTLCNLLGNFIIGLLTVLVSYFVVWVRGVVPRFRYDLLIRLCWQGLLVISLVLFINFSCFLIMG